VHPGLEHTPHAIALQHPDETRDMVLVGVREDDDVDPPVPGWHAGVKLSEDAIRVRPAVDEHPRAVATLHQD
jgi:hypothetical protein